MEVSDRVITSLRNIKYKDYKEFENFLKEYKDDITQLDESISQFYILTLFYKMSTKEQKQLSLEEIEYLLEGVHVAFNEPLKLNNILIKDGEIYGLIPNFEKVKSGELMEMDILFTDDNWIALMSVLYRPVIGGKKGVNKRGEYLIEPYDEYSETLFEDVSAYDVLAVRDFFIKSFLQLSQDSPTSLQKER
jgi:hypothetical protein